MKEDKKYVALKAKAYNCGLTKAGSWIYTEWLIYSSHSYRATVAWRKSIKECDQIMEELRTRGHHSFNIDEFNELTLRKQVYTGPISAIRYGKLISYSKKEWDIHVCDACDGSKWSFEYYFPTGEVLKTSNGSQYIYGNRVLEKLVSDLPRVDLYKGSSGCVYDIT